MIFNILKTEEKLFALLSETARALNCPVYLVGGFVRDRLLGRDSKDIDVVCVGSGIELAERLAQQIQPRPQVTVFKNFGTAMLRYHDIEIEFVGARKESYRAESRNPIVENGSLEDDLSRRDLTINALAVSLNEEDYGQIIDMFGGIEDLEKKILRTPLEPVRTFSDDPLRMLRAIRFASQLHFKIEDATLQGIAAQKERISIISQERITTELEKIILSKRPSVGFKLLFNTGLLKLIFPEMVALHGVETQNGWSHKDNFYHTLQVLDNLCQTTNKLWLRWAALLHDIAKPPTKKFHPEFGWTFHGHEVLGTKMAATIFKKLRLPLDDKLKYVQKLIFLHLRPIALTKDNISDSAVRRLLFEAGEDIDDLMLLCEADITSNMQHKVKRFRDNYEYLRLKIKEIEEKDKLRNWEPPISGELIMETFGLNPSREVGLIKTAIREAILDGLIENDYSQAYEFMLEKAAQMGLKKIF